MSRLQNTFDVGLTPYELGPSAVADTDAVFAAEKHFN